MDINWKSVSTELGQIATIVSQTFLDDYTNLSNTDILIISSGLIDIPDNRKATILQFVQNGGNVYIQSEYLVDLPGNATFKYLADNLGNTFNWQDEVTGNLNPMQIIGDLSNGIEDNAELTYYWYGTSGIGDANFIPFLKYNNKNWGFVYCPSVVTNGTVITTTDQDWVRTSNNNGLMANILTTLLTSSSLSVLPTVSIVSTNTPCDDSYTFTATINNNMPAISLEWLVNGQVVTDENGFSFSSNSLVDGDVVECRIAVTNACANYEYVSNPILIAPIFPIEIPEITITSDNNSYCQGQTITFTANTTQLSDATNLSYQWLVNGVPVSGILTEVFSTDFLNDQDLISCQLTYDNPCDTGMEITSNELAITINPLLNPMITINSDLTEICEGDLVTFTATASDIGIAPTYQWQIGGMNVGDNSPSFSSSGITNGQLVNCIVYTQALCSATDESNSNTIAITVNQVVNPGIEITSSTDTICNGEEVTFTAFTTDAGANPVYQWQIDGIDVGTDQPILSTADLEEGQQITCTLSVTESCASSASITSEPISIFISQGLVPTISITSTATTLCEGQSATFTASGDNHGSDPVYEWFVNGISVGANTDELLIENITEVQIVVCMVTNNEGCLNNNIAQSNEIIINISNVEIELLELAAENCGNADGLIEVVAIGGNAPYTYEWSNGINNSLITNMVAGVYSLIVTDANGCSGTTSYELLNNGGPQISEVLVTGVDCSGENGLAEVVIEDNSSEVNIEWFNADGELLSTSPFVQSLASGSYEIVVTNEYGCEVVETVIIEQVSPLIVAVNEDTRLDLGDIIRLEALVNTNQNISYEWFPAEGLSCTDCPNPIASPTSSIEYTVLVTNESGCTDSDKVFIQVIPDDKVFIPNAFSPNGDGVNDFFTVYAGDNVSRIKTLRVFDRWGAEVFGNQDFSPNVEPEGWNGVYKGKRMGEGVYVYFVEVEYIDGSTKIKKGDLSITF
jgi:gliding motility-associated-like protein